ncbi:reverse transcriptase domain-containing protein [Tanacetum coccineum]
MSTSLISLPRVDWKVESLWDTPFKCFLDAYKGVSPNPKWPRMMRKTALSHKSGVICYTKMPFGLKNAGATYRDVAKWEVRGLKGSYQVSRPKSLPLFKTLKKCTKKGDFRWTTEAEEAFTLLKQHIAALPTLVAPRPGEELIIYLSATHGAISAVLLTDRDSIQTPVYFVSKALKETEINYSAMEKLILALVFAAKRLRRYFQAHPIAVITDQPFKPVIL